MSSANYVDEYYRTIPLSNKHEMRVLTSKCLDTDEVLVDIRKFSLYGNKYDEIKRPTRKGIKFRVDNIPDVIIGLVYIMEHFGMVDSQSADEIQSIVKGDFNGRRYAKHG